MGNLWKRITGKRGPVIGTRTDLSEIACIVDRSGSMEPLRDDAIGGFNAFLDDQIEEKGIGNLTLVVFNEDVQEVHLSEPVQSVPRLNRKTFVPRGRTALFDAIGESLAKLNLRLAKQAQNERAGKVIVSILTDGQENSSRKFGQSDVAGLIKAHADIGWEFFFLAANQDAIVAADAINISSRNTVNFQATTRGVAEVMDTMSVMVSRSRIEQSQSEDGSDSESGKTANQ